MRIFHLSDLHIGLKLMNRDLREDQEYILNQIIDIAGREKPDVIVIAGDIYDRAVPSAEAVEVFDRFTASLTQTVPDTVLMMISGNHDSAPRVNCFRSVLSRQRLYMIGNPPSSAQDRIEQVTLEDEWGPVHFYLLPFVRPSMVKAVTGTRKDGSSLSYDEALHVLINREQIEKTQRNVLVSHQFYLPAGIKAEDMDRMDSEIQTVGNVDQVSADILQSFDYAALGHIHKPMKLGSEFIRYCGTPLATSVSEAGQMKGILEVELKEKGSRSVRVLPLTPLRQVRMIKGTLQEVLEQTCEDYVSVCLTDSLSLLSPDQQDRVRSAFPNLLEIRRERTAGMSMRRFEGAARELDPFTMCCAFLGEPDEEQKQLLQDVINTLSADKEGT